MRIITLLPEDAALRDAEAMLLVNHHQTQSSKLEALLEQRLSPRDDRHLSVAKVRVNLPSLCALHRTGEQCNPRCPLPETRKQLRKRREMLLGQDFGRRHDRRLIAIRRDLNRGCRGYDCLAGSNVSLEEQTHGNWRGQSLPNVVQRASLVASQLKRQRV